MSNFYSSIQPHYSTLRSRWHFVLIFALTVHKKAPKWQVGLSHLHRAKRGADGLRVRGLNNSRSDSSAYDELAMHPSSPLDTLAIFLRID